MEDHPEDPLVSDRPQIILADNQGGIRMTQNALGNTRAKDIDLRYHYVRDAWQNGKITLRFEPEISPHDEWITSIFYQGVNPLS